LFRCLLGGAHHREREKKKDKGIWTSRTLQTLPKGEICRVKKKEEGWEERGVKEGKKKSGQLGDVTAQKTSLRGTRRGPKGGENGEGGGGKKQKFQGLKLKTRGEEFATYQKRRKQSARGAGQQRDRRGQIRTL